MTIKLEKVIIVLFKLFLLIIVSTICNAQVHVKGYYRKDGTYVHPHIRSNPDGNPYNNWSYPGNVNPYTGNVATGNPETYLKNCQKNGNRLYNVVSSQTQFQNNQAQVYTRVLNIRQYPSIKSSVIGKLYYWDIVEVQRIEGDWAIVNYYYVDSFYLLKYQKGYVAAKYLIKR